MFEGARRKQFDMVLFWSLDRFSREGVLETLRHVQWLNSHSVEWFSFREEYLRGRANSGMSSSTKRVVPASGLLGRTCATSFIFTRYCMAVASPAR
jgi:hypothetical protein